MMPLIYAQKDEPQIIGNCIAWLFIPLGWIVGTMGILYGGGDLTVWQTLGQELLPHS